MCLRVCVCMYNVCSCANSSAISQAQILKLCSEETTIKGETPTIPFLWFFFPLFPFFSSFSFSIFFFLDLLTFLHPYLCSTGPFFFSLSLLPFHPAPPSLRQPSNILHRPPGPHGNSQERERGGARDSGRLTGDVSEGLTGVVLVAVILSKWPASSGPHTAAH